MHTAMAGTIKRGWTSATLPPGYRLGQDWWELDFDPTTDPTGPNTGYGGWVHLSLCQNINAGTLPKGACVAWGQTAGDIYNKVAYYADGNLTTNDEDLCAGVVDEYVSSAGVLTNYYFLLVRGGPTQMIAGGTIAVGDRLVLDSDNTVGQVIKQAAVDAANLQIAVGVALAAGTDTNLFRAHFRGIFS